MKNKKVKQMICDSVQNRMRGNCGCVWWESTVDFKQLKYPNQILMVDGAYDLESAFWHEQKQVSLTANQLRGK